MTTYNQKERRFTTVLILIYALLSCGVIAGSILLYRSEYASLLADDSKELLSIVELKAKQITDYRKERFSEANFVYENASFMEDVLSFRSNPRSPKFEVQLDNWLLPILNNHNYESIKIIDTGGVILYAIGRYDKRHVERMFHFGKQSLNENKISFGNLVLHEADTSYHLEIFVPLTLKSSGEKIGVVNFTIDPQIELFDLMQSWPIESRTAEVLVVRKEGDDVIFQNELRFRKNTALKLKYPINTKDLPAARAARGETKVMIGIDYKGHEVLAAGKQIPNSDWIVIAKIDMEEVLEPRTSKTFFILAMMTALLMALSSAFFILRRAIRMHEMKVEIQFVIAVKRLNRVYQVLSNVNQAIVRISDRDELLNEICRIAIDDGGFRLCWIGFIDRETGIIDPAAKAGPAVKYLDKIKFTSERDLLSGDGPNGKTLRSGQYVIQNDLWKSARMAPWGDRARKYKLKSSASFPLMQNNVTIGAVSLYADQFNFFTSDEIRLLQELSADLSYALSNIDRDKISKISEQALRESEDRYRDLVENSLDIICSHDMDGKILSLNKRGAQLLDYAHDDLLKMNIRDILIPDVRSGFDNYLSEIRLNGSARGIMAVQTAAGKKRVWEYYNTLRTDGVSTPIVRGTAQDVTERRRAEEQARITEARLRNIIEHSTNLFYSHTTDQVLTYVSPQSRHFLDCEPEEAMIRWTEFITDNPANQIGITATQKAIDTAQRQPPYELELKTKHGRIIWVEVFEAPVVSNGRTVAIVGSLNDITYRKKAEAALKSNEELFRRLFQESTDPILILDERGFTDCNQAAISILAYSSKDEFLNKKPWELSPTKQPDGRLSSEKAEAMIKKALEQGHNRFEWMHSKSDGTEFPVEVMLTSVILDGRQAYYTIWRDISERKRAETALRESESQLKLALEASKSGAWMWDMASGNITWSDENYRVLGYEPRSVPANRENWLIRIHPEDRDRVLSQVNQVIENKSLLDIEYRLLLPDRTVRWLIDRAKFTLDKNGNPIQMHGVHIDITDLKMAQQKLLLQSSALDAAANSIVITDSEGTIEWVNPAFSRLTGFAADEAIGKNPRDLVKSGVHDQSYFKNMWETIIGGKVWSGETTNRRKDGTFYIEEQIITPLQTEGGKITHFISVKQDITDRKKAEESLRESDERFKLISRATNDAMWDWNIVTGENWWNDRFYALFGFAESVVQPSLQAWTALIHPEDRERVVNHIDEAVHGISLGWTEEFRIQFADGTYGSVFDRAFILRDNSGNAMRVIGSMLDMSLYKKTQQQLRYSESRLRTIVDAEPECVKTLSPDGRLLTINPAGLKMIEADSEDQVIGKLLSGIIVPEDRQAFEKLSQDVLSGKTGTLQFQITALKGTTRWLETHAVPLRDENDEIESILAVTRDVTESRRSIEALRESEEKYKAFFDDDLTGDFISTPEGKLLACNPAFAKMFGYDTVEETLQIDVHSLYSDKKARENMLVRLKREKRLEYFSSELIRKDGKKIYVIENMIGTFDKSGKLTEIKGYLFDDTRRRSLETQLIQAQKMESLGTLAGGIAHDFNNILAIIMGHTSLIQRKAEGNTHVVQNAETITKATQRGAGLVKQLLTFARKTEIVLESILIQDTVNEITKFIEQTFPKTIVIHSDCAPNLPPILADATQIHQVLLNLCINARDAMPHGGTLTISAQRITKLHAHDRNTKTQAVEFVHLKVSDTGVGIEENVKNHIFEPFFTTKGRDRGTGLGLATVYGIIESHRGFIDVESEVGKGSTFNLYFPVQQSFIQHEVDTALVSEIAGGKETVLIVDDEESMRYYLKSILSEKGYHVLSASDGQEALDEFKKHADDIGLVLTDLGLPKISGEEFLETIFKINPAVKAIVASGYFESKMKVMLVKLGVKEFVQKPYAPDEILQKVREVIDLP